MNLFIIFSFVLFIFFLYSYILKGTIFGLSFKNQSYHGFFILYPIILSIVPSVLLLNTFPITDFWVAFKVKQDSVFYISIIIIISYIFFLLILYFVSRIYPRYFFISTDYDSPCKKKYILVVRFVISFSLIIILLLWFIFGQGHSFSLAIMDNVSVSTFRMTISEHPLTKFAKYFFIIIGPLIIAIIASPVYVNNKKERVLSVILLLYIASWGGGKEPILILFIVGFIVYCTTNKVKVSIKAIFLSVLFILFILFITYHIVLLQYENLNINEFLDYFSQRVFVAQMIGVYEEFNIHLFNTDYIFHGLPFASFFVDYPIFHKDLMMVSEDRYDATTIGIKNTYFIAEAYGMGGWPLLLISPFIFGVNLAISYIIVLYIFNKLFPYSDGINKLIVSVFLFSYMKVTGGFSDLMLFKNLIMLLILLSPVLLFAYISKIKFK